VNGIRIGGYGALETAARFFRTAQPMVLLPQQNEQRNILRREQFRPMECLVREGKIEIVGRGDAQLEPKLHHAGKTTRQIPIARQRLILPAAEQLLLSLLPAVRVARRTLQFDQIRGHWFFLPAPKLALRRIA
jgi:hypothetical protein